MSIHGIGSNDSVQKIVSKPIQKKVESGSAQPGRSTDKVELSGVSHLLHALKSGADFRADKVASVRAQLDAGTYDEDKKFDIAADRMLDDLL